MGSPGSCPIMGTSNYTHSTSIKPCPPSFSSVPCRCPSRGLPSIPAPLCSLTDHHSVLKPSMALHCLLWSPDGWVWPSASCLPRWGPCHEPPGPAMGLPGLLLTAGLLALGQLCGWRCGAKWILRSPPRRTQSQRETPSCFRPPGQGAQQRPSPGLSPHPPTSFTTQSLVSRS